MNTDQFEQPAVTVQEGDDATGGPAADPLGGSGSGRRRGIWRPAVLLVLALATAATVSSFGNRKSPHLTDRLITVGGALLFLGLAMMATFGLAAQLRSLVEPRVGNAHAVVLRLVVVLVGGFTTLLTTLSVLSIPIGQLILGGAFTGVIFGIAGQQTLSNLFAGIVLLLARPFTVGATVRLRSGALGGSVDGQVLEIGLAYLRMQTSDGPVSIPNSQVLNAVVSPPPADPVP
jgi:small-conductance mechanosensitive channel